MSYTRTRIGIACIVLSLCLVSACSTATKTTDQTTPPVTGEVIVIPQEQFLSAKKSFGEPEFLEVDIPLYAWVRIDADYIYIYHYRGGMIDLLNIRDGSLEKRFDISKYGRLCDFEVEDGVMYLLTDLPMKRTLVRFDGETFESFGNRFKVDKIDVCGDRLFAKCLNRDGPGSRIPTYGLFDLNLERIVDFGQLDYSETFPRRMRMDFYDIAFNGQEAYIVGIQSDDVILFNIETGKKTTYKNTLPSVIEAFADAVAEFKSNRKRYKTTLTHAEPRYEAGAFYTMVRGGDGYYLMEFVGGDLEIYRLKPAYTFWNYDIVRDGNTLVIYAVAKGDSGAFVLFRQRCER